MYKNETEHIETENLLLIACDTGLLECAIKGDQYLAERLNIHVTSGWTEFGKKALQYVQDKIRLNPLDNGWWTYFPVHKAENALIGSGGYKGRPTEDGIVEIGYEIAPAYRNMGYATEMAKGLIDRALDDPRVKTIQAHTLAEENASARVLRKCGFNKVEILNDPLEGQVWKWQLKVED